MSWLRSLVLGITVLGLVVSGPSVTAKDKGKDGGVPVSVTVSFGAGLNTLAAANHHILPHVIKVRITPATATTPLIAGVVNFVVAGFHQPFVYQPGVTPEDVLANAPAFPGTLFINYGVVAPGVANPAILFYLGLNPSNAAAPTGANPGSLPNNAVIRSNLGNRVESVGFTTPGTYLVICNVNPHFRDGMYAFVKVVTGDDDN